MSNKTRVITAGITIYDEGCKLSEKEIAEQIKEGLKKSLSVNDVVVYQVQNYILGGEKDDSR